MNTIYKVIWSKAKNCYVVASEIARSHTKSATGSEKMGGYGKRALLALAAATAIVCGGFVNVGASVQSEIIAAGGTTSNPVLTVDNTDDATQLNKVISAAKEDKLVTKDNISGQLTDYAKTTDVTTAKNELDGKIAAKADTTTVDAISTRVGTLETTVGNATSGLVKDVADAKTDITNIKNTIGDDSTGLVKKVNDNTNAIATKANASDVYDKNAIDTKLGNYTTTADLTNKLNTKANADDVYSKTEAENKFADKTATENALTTKANQSDLEAATGRITTVENKTGNLSADGKSLTGMDTVSGTNVSGDTVNAGKLNVTGEITNGAGVTTTLGDIKNSMTQTETNKNDIKDLQKKTTNISYTDGAGTSIDGITVKDGNIVGNGNSAITGITNIATDNINGKSLAGTTVATVKEVTDAVESEKTARENAIGSLTEDKNYIKKDKNVSDNLVELDKQAKTNADAIAQEKTDRENAIGSLAEDKNYIKKDKNVSDNLVELDKQAKTNADAIAQEKTDRENAIGSLTEDKNYIKKDKNVSDNLVELDKQAKTNADAIEETNQRTAGITRDDARNETSIEGKVTVDTNGNIKAEGTITSSGLDAGAGEIKTTGKVSAGDVSTGTLETTGDATIGGDLTVAGKLNVGEISMKNDKLDAATGNKHDSATSITADGISNIASIENNGTTTKSQFSHNEKGTFNSASKGDATDRKEATSNVTADGVENIAKDSEGNNNTFTQTSTDTKNTLTDKDGNTSSTRQDGKGIYGYAKDKDGNKSYTKQEGDRIAESVIGQDGKETKSEMTSTDITNTAQDGTITNDAKDIVNKASGDMTNTVGGNLKNKVTGDIENSATNITNKTTGDMTNTIGGKLTTTVTGATEENYNGGLTTNVTGEENHTVTGNQNNKVTGKQTNTIDGGQENNISGGQINNITGDQTTTITGNKKETVTENVTEDYQKDLTTTVGGNEIHDVKGTKTETVEGKVTENFKNGQETNVTGDQTTNVSGTQTTNATDISRNASSGMIDTVDNAYGTNKETKVAGKTTTEVSIKGTGEKAEYIRGATESRDYIIKGTLSNSETKTAESTSTAITDGTNTSATIQDKTQISGSVTNGTSSAVSNVKADSIDTAVKEGTNTSLISQKKDSITSAVGNGTTSTVIQQGDKDITIASNGGTVGIAGKDIINNATDEITNTAGTKITDQVGNNTRVTDTTSITDTVDNGTTKTETKQDAKDITNTATDGTIKNDAKDIENNASNSMTETVGGTNVTKKTAKSTKSTIENSDVTTAIEQTDEQIQTSVIKKDGSASNVSTDYANASANQVTEDGQTSTVINNKNGLLIQNSDNQTSFTTEDHTSTGAAQGWTNIKGNEISTGKVEANYVKMDYADVMKDLGVRGNANIAGKTTTGELEVTGKSTLKGDVTMEGNATVKKNLTVEGTTTTKDLKVTDTLDVTGKSNFHDDVTMDKNLTVGGNVDAGSFTVKGTDIKIDQNGIDAGNLPITNVGDGSIAPGSKDAVNGGQLYDVKTDLEGKVNKVGANAAAMANLHPMEFDPDSKWNIAAAMGNYGSETATAMGLFYRPNEDVMVNLSTAFGTGENMVGGGVSVRLGQGGNKLTRKENNELKAQVNDLTARMDALLSVLNPNMSKDFPDVPENHWAYEAVSRLAGNDIVQGYPDGEFHGERTMTRYEMAEIIYKALSRGAEAERELVEEFKPELQAMAASNKASAEAPTTNE